MNAEIGTNGKGVPHAKTQSREDGKCLNRRLSGVACRPSLPLEKTPGVGREHGRATNSKDRLFAADQLYYRD
ncbi:MAG: hypothetical protein U9R68_08100 [Planctomycetota bacterium]|nr:hypothetical protein [Planctomycetota bacterium]